MLSLQKGEHCRRKRVLTSENTSFFGQGNLFSRRENKLSHRENIFLHRENLFSRCENNFLTGISCLCIGKKRINH